MPSLHSSTRSPSSRSTWNRSGSTSCTLSMALRIRLRCGWVRASASVIRPSSIRVCTNVWSVVSWRSVPSPQEVGAAVADVAHAEAGAVEEGDHRGGAGAVERRVLVDELADPVVGAVQGARDLGEQVLGRLLGRACGSAGSRRGRDVAAGGAAHAVGDREQPGAGVPGVLVVLADPPDVGDRRVDQVQVGHGLLPQLEDGLADPDLRAEGEGGGLGDADGADVGAVGRPEVLDEPLVAGRGDPGVPGGDVVVVEADRGVGAAADEERRLVEVGALAGVAALDDQDVGGGAAPLARRLGASWAALPPPAAPGPRRGPGRRTCRSGSPRSRTARRSRGSRGRRSG